MDQARTLERIFTDLAEAMGGAAALERITSIAAAAHCRSPRGSYVTEIQSMRGDRLMFTQLWPEHAPLVAYLNGGYAWVRDKFTGAVEPLDPISASIIRAHEFQILPIVMRSRYSELQLAGEDEFSGVPCDAIRMIDELGLPCWSYFSRESHMWLGMMLTDPRQPEDHVVRVRVDEWMPVEQVRLPSRVVASDAAGEFVLDFHTIRLSTVNPAIFEVPSEILAGEEAVAIQSDS